MKKEFTVFPVILTTEICGKALDFNPLSEKHFMKTADRQCNDKRGNYD